MIGEIPGIIVTGDTSPLQSAPLQPYPRHETNLPDESLRPCDGKSARAPRRGWGSAGINHPQSKTRNEDTPSLSGAGTG